MRALSYRSFASSRNVHFHPSLRPAPTRSCSAARIALLLAPLTFVPRAVGADDVADLAAIEQRFAAVAERVGPSVVSIRVERQYFAPVATAATASPRDALEHLIVVNGSGSIVGSDGLILTNEHVVQGATRIDVILESGQRRSGIVLASDPRSDLAILKIDSTGLPCVTFGNWNSVRKGQWAFVLGNPFGIGGDGRASVAIGIISNLGRRLPGLGQVDDRFYGNMIQTTAAINPGNSGGPLFNVSGELVGVVTAMHTRSGQSDGIGFAIPLTPAKRSVIERLMRGESIEHGYIGLSVRDVDDERRAPDDPAVVAASVAPDGPAARAGIRAGDLIVSLNDEPVRNSGDLAECVGTAPIGNPLIVRLSRDRRMITTHVTVERRNAGPIVALRSGAVIWRGIRLMDAPATTAVGDAPHGAAGVVVIDVLDNGPGARARVRVGDVIERVAGAAVSDVVDFRRRVATETGAVTLEFRGVGSRVIEP